VKLHPHAAGLYVILDPDWRRKIFRGGLLLCIPVLGWPAVLGYRTRLVRHLFADLPAPLPDWEGQFFGCVRDGLKAMAVIFGHLLPIYVAIAVTVHGRGYVPDRTALWLLALFVAFPIFSTLSLPLACLGLTLGAGGPWLSPGECALAIASYALVVFLVPAGFLRVSQTGRFRDAFAFWHSVPLVCRNLAAYAEAWWYSGLMSLGGHLALPLAPWGVVWCYVGILVVFNELLHQRGLAPGHGCLAHALADPRLQARQRIGLGQLADARGEPVTVLSVGLFSAPLPRWR